MAGADAWVRAVGDGHGLASCLDGPNITDVDKARFSLALDDDAVFRNSVEFACGTSQIE